MQWCWPCLKYLFNVAALLIQKWLSVKQVFLHLLLEKVPIYLLAYEIRKNTFSNLYIKNENRSTFHFFLSYLYLTVVLKDTVSTNFSLYVLKAYSAI